MLLGACCCCFAPSCHGLELAPRPFLATDFFLSSTPHRCLLRVLHNAIGLTEGGQNPRRWTLVALLAVLEPRADASGSSTPRCAPPMPCLGGLARSVGAGPWRNYGQILTVIRPSGANLRQQHPGGGGNNCCFDPAAGHPLRLRLHSAARPACSGSCGWGPAGGRPPSPRLLPCSGAAAAAAPVGGLANEPAGALSALMPGFFAPPGGAAAGRRPLRIAPRARKRAHCWEGFGPLHRSLPALIRCIFNTD